MSRQLPTNPSLEQLKKQARELLQACQSGDPQARGRLKSVVPRLYKLSEADLALAKLTLRDAQLVLAREYGFPSWVKLKGHLEELTSTPTEMTREQILQLATERLDDAAQVIRSLRWDSQKLGIVMLTLGQEICGEVMKHLSDGDIEAVTRAVGELGDVDAELQDEVLIEFGRLLLSGDVRPPQPPPETRLGDYIQGALERAVGPRRATEIIDRQQVKVSGMAKGPKPKLSKEYLATKKELKRKLHDAPTGLLPLDELREILVTMTEIVRVEGVLALEEYATRGTGLESLLKYGLCLSVDCTDPEVVVDLLETQTSSLVHAYESRCQMIVAGIAAIQSGANPRILDHKLSAIHGSDSQ